MEVSLLSPEPSSSPPTIPPTPGTPTRETSPSCVDLTTSSTSTWTDARTFSRESSEPLSKVIRPPTERIPTTWAEQPPVPVIPRATRAPAPILHYGHSEPTDCQLLGKRDRTSGPPVAWSSPQLISRPRPRNPLSVTQELPLVLEIPPTPPPLLESDEPDSPPPEKLQRRDAFHEPPSLLSTSQLSDEEDDLDRPMGSYYCEACFCVPCLCYEQDETSQDPYE